MLIQKLADPEIKVHVCFVQLSDNIIYTVKTRA